MNASSKPLLLLLVEEAKAALQLCQNGPNVRCLLLCSPWFDEPQPVCLFPQLGNVWSKVLGVKASYGVP